MTRTAAATSTNKVLADSVADLQKRITEMETNHKTEIAELRHLFSGKFDKLMDSLIKLHEDLPKFFDDAVNTAIQATTASLKDAIAQALSTAQPKLPPTTSAPPWSQTWLPQSPRPLFQAPSAPPNPPPDRSEFERNELDDRKKRKASTILVNFQVPPIIAQNPDEMSSHLRTEVAKFFPLASNAIEVECTGNERPGKPRLLRLKFENEAESENFKWVVIGDLRDMTKPEMDRLRQDRVKVLWDKTPTQLRVEQYWKANVPPGMYLDQMMWFRNSFDGRPIFKPLRGRADNPRPTQIRTRPTRIESQGNSEASQ